MTLAVKTCRSGRHTYLPRDRANKSGCPACAAEAKERSQARRAAQVAAWRESNPAAWARIARRAKLKRMGLTEQEFDDLLALQNGQCPICGTELQQASGDRDFDCDAVIDHDHETGLTRGLLCHRCNMALGLLRDNTDALRRAADYIRHGGVMPDVVG